MNRTRHAKLIWWLLAAVMICLVSAGYSWTRYVDYHYPEMRVRHDPWKRYLCRQILRYVFDSHSESDWLEGGSSQYVLLMWRPAAGWKADVVINLKNGTISGGAENGTSFVVPYPGPKAKPLPLSDEQMRQVVDLLARLPPGEDYKTSRLNFESEIHLSLWKYGKRQVLHYPRSRPPEPVAKLIQVLQLQFDSEGFD